MIIAKFIKKDYTTIYAYEGTYKVKNSDSISRGIVVLEDNEPIGILTIEDLAKKNYQIIIDCLSKKPVVEQTDKISDVLYLMESSGNNILMVYDNNLFVGTISSNDILSHLHNSFKSQKKTIQSAAHDLKNPIASIKAISEMLQENLKLVENRELLDLVCQCCTFAQEIIEDILISEQLVEEKINYTNESFDELIEECVIGFSAELKAKQISIIKNLKLNRAIKFDKPKFKRAIYNLLSNSIKFSHKKGQIELSTGIYQNMLRFKIKDHGIGIPEKIQDEIFDKFTRAKRIGTAGESATGLGMYLTKQIVEMHNGSIVMESDGKSGTTFHIFLNLS